MLSAMLYFFQILVFFVVYCSAEQRVVNMSYGAIRGELVKSRRGNQGYAFLGIPMTEPPIGDLRFKEAVPIKPWAGIVDTFEYHACPQPIRKLRNKTIKVSEDCLQNNVYTSKTCLEKGGCPVMAFVHGGLRYFISPEKTPVENVITSFSNEEKNIVYIGLPYRLGVCAWLNLASHLETTRATNLANRDVIFGLNWIKKEIRNFGGDPNRITLMGHSSGAQMVAELVASPVADDLYNQVILLSAPFWGERNTESNLEYSRRIAEKIGCASANETYDKVERVIEIENCLRQKPQDELYPIQESIDYEVPLLDGVWIDGPKGVFQDAFENLLKRKFKKRNYLIGTTSAETKATRSIVTNDGQINQTRLDYVCTILAYEYNYERPEGFRRVCKEYYNDVENVANIGDDYDYYYPTGHLADKFSEDGTCFVYSFEYPLSGPRYTWNASVVTPLHAEDLKLFLWGEYDNFTEKDFIITETYSEILANFITTGNPTYRGQRWISWTKKERPYFVIDFDEKMKMPGLKYGYHKEAANFFEVTVPKAAGISRPPIDLPPQHDNFFNHIPVGGMVSIWTNESGILSKEDDIAKEIGIIWKDHLMHLLKLAEKRNNSFNWLNLLLAIVIVALVVGISYVLWRHWKRRNYQAF